MANIVLKGEIVAIMEAQIIGTNFEKREMWVREYDTEYPQTWNLEAQQGDCNKLDAFKKGDKVECHVSIRGRYGKKKDGQGWWCINTLKVWRIDRVGQTASKPAPQPAPQQRPEPGPRPQPNNIDIESPDDLPF